MSEGSKYYLLWRDLPKIAAYVSKHGGKVTPEIAERLIERGWMKRP